MTIEFQGLTPLLSVFDMPTSLAFYRGILGFEVVADSGNGDESSWVWLRKGDADLMLNDQYEPGSRPEKPPADRVAWHHDTCLYFGCPSTDSAYEYLRSHGISVNPPEIAPYGMKQLNVSDPDGYNLCFQWRATELELAMRLRTLGEAERKMPGKREDSVKHYEQAVELLRKCNEPSRLAHTIRHLGDVHYENGELDLAGPFLNEAVEIYRGIGERESLDYANALRSLAVWNAGNDTSAALDRFQEAKDLYTKLGITEGAAEILRRISMIEKANERTASQ